jgi:hypothetical protein
MLNDNKVVEPARRAKGSSLDWVNMRGHFLDLRARGEAGEIVADLVIARYVRGAAHYKFPDVEYLEMETIFVALVRAAFFCFNELNSDKIQSCADFPPQ